MDTKRIAELRKAARQSSSVTFKDPPAGGELAELLDLAEAQLKRDEAFEAGAHGKPFPGKAQWLDERKESPPTLAGSFTEKQKQILAGEPPAQRVPLEAKDIPPGSAIKRPDDPSWAMVVVCMTTAIESAHSGGTWNTRLKELMSEGWLILRPGQTEWEPCSKPATEAPGPSKDFDNLPPFPYGMGTSEMLKRQELRAAGCTQKEDGWYCPSGFRFAHNLTEAYDCLVKGRGGKATDSTYPPETLQQ